MDPIEVWEGMVEDELTRAEARGERTKRGVVVRRLSKSHPDQHAAYLKAYTAKHGEGPRKVRGRK